MAARPPTGKASGATPGGQPSPAAAPVKHGSLRWVTDVLRRSIRLQQRQAEPQADADPRRKGGADAPLSVLQQQRAELGARLLVHDPATQSVRNLFIVHDELGSGGWLRVKDLSREVMGAALTEARSLAVHEPSPVLLSIIEQLHELITAAAAKTAHREAFLREWDKPAGPEVSEVAHEEYELMERSWMGTLPAGLELPTSAP